ncbi:class I SAM-dependent methyltransferase [Prolixibacter denitrificans]|uniref:SAM-dependent methyltransferase n=1 Tax=Prolixibacter denitrificans TaxID=1541063 RepID=A0A2P8CBB4_9BACT|nr:methyltransferase domain-containing protein [Prolixibacter denitrificans]PSK82264.1 ubiquinone/menaquinone biosynthesis C-methylase UbiE [Prolixibacter denitrificans]GET22987.1 SAM-dependent methyltransferase [Prolixibacter denitrificans]
MDTKIKKRYNRIAKVYDILESPMESGFSRWREKLLSEVKGKTLEVGVGTGKNLTYYPGNIDLTGIDFSENMIERARRKSGNKPNVRLMVMDAEKMDFEANTFDTVVTSCVYCSVPDPVQGMKEMKRVCKPGGRLLMLEHVRSNHKMVGKLMDWMNPIPLHLYGANINRETYENLLKAGFEPNDITIKHLWYDIVLLIKVNIKK